jgi:hypothetical protein
MSNITNFSSNAKIRSRFTYKIFAANPTQLACDMLTRRSTNTYNTRFQYQKLPPKIPQVHQIAADSRPAIGMYTY